ncbi:UNVERIFIED_CONTAM: 2-(3-amino-3-carboxypropyl)histidine synthase subunit [Sesamum angustifolium]|uniref:2-(3-amino-3-carboxypropyl)histidine synthase subunit n=1 Tax=Sesamum angustifolium TaxID=2727405 RepID=A0AAW2MIR2_9LAMI
MAETTTDKTHSDLLVGQHQPLPKARPKRFVKNQIPDSILNDAALNSAISLLPANYNFEIHKIIWRARSTNATRVALQFPEGLLMYSLSSLISSKPSPASHTALSSATSPTALAASMTSRHVRSTPTSWCTLDTAALSQLTPPPSLCSTSSLKSPSTRGSFSTS